MDPGTKQIESKGTMPALCCYDTYISVKMTLKSTRGSNTVVFIGSLGRALTLGDSLSPAEYGPCPENFASGLRTMASVTWGASPGAHMAIARCYLAGQHPFETCNGMRHQKRPPCHALRLTDGKLMAENDSSPKC